jgi:hypothetical protein
MPPDPQLRWSAATPVDPTTRLVVGLRREERHRLFVRVAVVGQDPDAATEWELAPDDIIGLHKFFAR